MSDETNVPARFKPTAGWKTSEFWFSLAAASIPIVEAARGAMPPQTAVKVTGTVAAVYAIGRSVVKLAQLFGYRR